ncbi:hypothetical protein, partial [Kiloniella majae]|uniref:hypothetical protein n=1 Tax=Kiloniella majae TaxID=1938558 RepID=UPI001C3F861C
MKKRRGWREDGEGKRTARGKGGQEAGAAKPAGAEGTKSVMRAFPPKAGKGVGEGGRGRRGQNWGRRGEKREGGERRRGE